MHIKEALSGPELNVQEYRVLTYPYEALVVLVVAPKSLNLAFFDNV